MITGGRTRGHYNNPWNLVSRYNRNGFVEDLPNLNNARMGHGCGHYVNSNKQKVCINIYQNCGENNDSLKNKRIFVLVPVFFKVFLVAGGNAGNAEILIAGSSSWVVTGSLPMSGVGIIGISFQNRVIMTGMD